VEISTTTWLCWNDLVGQDAVALRVEDADVLALSARIQALPLAVRFIVFRA
jgi:hypothetical protein